ncbi:hypothetical protein COOONC_18835 [Cooperia oncophora]
MTPSHCITLQTYSGLFCVVVNPYKRLPIYTDSIAEQYKGKKRKEMPPHIFAVTDEAYRRVNQALGKYGQKHRRRCINILLTWLHLGQATISVLETTTASPVQINHDLWVVWKSSSCKRILSWKLSEIAKQSRTTIRHVSGNSSEFISTRLARSIEFYLLEKSRILRQSADERCFHIFYQLLKGATIDQRGALLLEQSPNNYNFLSNGDIWHTRC